VTVIEAHEYMIFKGAENLSRLSCAQCAAESLMVTPDEAAALRGVTSRVIYQWVEAGVIHYTESAEGWLLVCPGSLPVSADFHNVIEEGERS